MPKFSGDVREYAIFRVDFKHTIETRYSKRDAMTILRTCLVAVSDKSIRESEFMSRSENLSTQVLITIRDCTNIPFEIFTTTQDKTI